MRKHRHADFTAHITRLAIDADHAVPEAAHISVGACLEHGGGGQAGRGLAGRFKGGGGRHQQHVHARIDQRQGHIQLRHIRQQRQRLLVIAAGIFFAGNHHALHGHDAIAAHQRHVVGHGIDRVGIVAHHQQASAIHGKGADHIDFHIAQILLRRGKHQHVHLLQRIAGEQIDKADVVVVAGKEAHEYLKRRLIQLGMSLKETHRWNGILRYVNNGLGQLLFVSQTLDFKNAKLHIVALRDEILIGEHPVAPCVRTIDNDGVRPDHTVHVALKAAQHARAADDIGRQHGDEIAEHFIALHQVQHLRIHRTVLIQQVQFHLMLQSAQYLRRLRAGGGVAVEAQVTFPAVFILQRLHAYIDQHAHSQENRHQQRPQLAVTPAWFAETSEPLG